MSNNWQDSIYCAPPATRVNALMAEFNRAADRFFERKGISYASWGLKEVGVAAIKEAQARRKKEGKPIDHGEPVRDAVEKRGAGTEAGTGTSVLPDAKVAV